jgi:N-acetylglucosamine-6-phosphate deacetylase
VTDPTRLERGLATIRGRLVTPSGILEDGYLTLDGDRITEAGPVSDHPGPEALPAPVGTVLPGLVDVHCHGGGGAAVTSGEPDQALAVAEHHRSFGTTSLLLSTVTDSPARMLAAISAAAGAASSGAAAGVHLEGPFLAPSRCGAQDPRHLRAPDLGLARELLAAGDGHVRTMTIAPELPGADGLTELLAEHGVTAAVGHTDGDVAVVAEALARPGTDLVTHLFNGMPPLHHRSPGPVGAALAAAVRGQARVELIADGVHLADETVAMMFALLGPDRVVLVTDAMAAAGMADGDYTLGSQRVRVTDGVARLGDTESGSIAGGTARLLEVVRRCVRRAGVALTDAVAAASSSPAAVLGLTGDVGALAPGHRADLVVVDMDLRPVRVMRRGTWLT